MILEGQGGGGVMLRAKKGEKGRHYIEKET